MLIDIWWGCNGPEDVVQACLVDVRSCDDLLCWEPHVRCWHCCVAETLDGRVLLCKGSADFHLMLDLALLLHCDAVLELLHLGLLSCCAAGEELHLLCHHADDAGADSADSIDMRLLACELTGELLQVPDDGFAVCLQCYQPLEKVVTDADHLPLLNLLQQALVDVAGVLL